MIDLHLHSTFSDGTATPEELVREAEKLGLKAIALTDHDETAGLPSFLKAGKDSLVETIPGVEIAVSWYGGSLHILGLFIDHEEPSLQALLKTIREFRDKRNKVVCQKLKEAGAEVSFEDVENAAGGRVVGRPHFAQILVEQGHAADLRDAFNTYLVNGCPAFSRRYLPLPNEAINVVRKAGGLAIWAHPVGMRELPQSKLRQTAAKMKSMGLAGIEAYYSEYSPQQEAMVKKVAGELNLLESGGTDWHGERTPGLTMGTGKGELVIPDDLLVKMYALLRG